VIRVFVLFLVLSLMFAAVIAGTRYLTGKQLLNLTKIAGYSIICSLLALLTMFGLVVLF
jgi:hypothetical protein